VSDPRIAYVENLSQTFLGLRGTNDTTTVLNGTLAANNSADAKCYRPQEIDTESREMPNC
jgi:hypothetical protein